jgi:hypothetical protein
MHLCPSVLNSADHCPYLHLQSLTVAVEGPLNVDDGQLAIRAARSVDDSVAVQGVPLLPLPDDSSPIRP